MQEPNLCDKCATAFKVVPLEQMPLSEQDQWVEDVYSALGAFFCGAMLGIFLGIVED